MSAKDLYHETVKIALLKEGWIITDDPLQLKIGTRNAAIDLGAQKLIAAERGATKIAVEIKSFIGASFMSDLEKAWGQFFLYAKALKKREPERYLYLAVRQDTAEILFREEVGELLRSEPGFRLLVFNETTQEIVQWQPSIPL